MSHTHRLAAAVLPLIVACVSPGVPTSVATAAAVEQPGSQPLMMFTDQATAVIQDTNGKRILELKPDTWGPDWGWSGIGKKDGRYEADGDGGAVGAYTRPLGKAKGVGFTYTMGLTPQAPRSLQGRAALEVDRDTELTLSVLSLIAGPDLQGQDRLRYTTADGTEHTSRVPPKRGPLAEAVTELSLLDAEGDAFRFVFEKPVKIMGERNTVRVVLAEGQASADHVNEVRYTLALPEASTYHLTEDQVPLPPDWDRWFAWKPDTKEGSPTAIGMADWLEAPAGKHGDVTMDGDRLIYNGKPFKVWGTNRAYASIAPKQSDAPRIAGFYAEHGINAVRFHKYGDGSGWAGLLDGTSATAFDPQRLDDLDFFVKELKDRGIYVKLSSNFGKTPMGQKEKATMPFAEKAYEEKPKGYFRVPQGALWFSPELQDIQARQLTMLLEHRNPHTGMTYADDPAVMVVELLNENTTYFNLFQALKSMPLIKQRAGEQFAAWLREKYGDAAGLDQAWGDRGGLNVFAKQGFGDESLDGKVYPFGNGWYFDPANQPHTNARMLDTMVFLSEVQEQVFAKMTEAVRATGYDGLMVAGNWQAGRAVSHVLNLKNDADVGIVDRHNYFSGPASMLAKPGSGMLSAGLQQVDDRPFMLSEWIHVVPSEFSVEGPILIGAYGMGLNGWDVSYIFQNKDDGRYSPKFRDAWDLTVPNVLGVFPAVSRMVHRGDVTEAPQTFTLNAHLESVKSSGELDYEDTVEQAYDVKTFSSDKVPAAALAVGRVAVDFTDAPTPTPSVDVEAHRSGGLLRSLTGQLAWSAGEHGRDGYAIIDTPGTQGVVGFTRGQTLELGDLSITTQTPYAAVLVTASDPDADLATGNRLLVTTIARARNDGQRMIAGTRVSQGDGPIMVEPVVAELTFKADRRPTVHVLDQAGRRTGQTVPARDGTVSLDGAKHQTIYYEVTF